MITDMESQPDVIMMKSKEDRHTDTVRHTTRQTDRQSLPPCACLEALHRISRHTDTDRHKKQPDRQEAGREMPRDIATEPGRGTWQWRAFY